MKRLFFSLFVFCSCCTLSGTAQPSSWRMDIHLGATTYVGDLSDHPFYSENWKPSVGLGVQYQWSAPFSSKLNFSYGQLSGSDQHFTTQDWPSGDRLMRFTTSFSQLSFSLEYHFLESRTLGRQRKLSPYLSAGLGIIIFDPDPDYGFTRNPELEQAILNDGNAGYANIAGNINLEAGIDWRLFKQWSVGVNAAVYPTNTDYLDGVSLSGNPNQKDWFAIGSLRLQYQFNHKPDRDGDGIADELDLCPDLPGQLAMDGCPDSDRDGLHDEEDLCPSIPGNISLSGCPDQDGDGVADKEDLCPTEYGPFNRGGCPIEDRDQDGIEDKYDKCPDAMGPPEREGCPIVDSDQDGILDEDDKCPNAFGLPIFGGCPDQDGDGIEDSRDACPTLFGVYTNNGCPEVLLPEEVAAEINGQALLYESGSADIPRYGLLDQIVQFLQENPEYKLRISGYTDQEGDPQRNKELSETRARRCYRYLNQQGISGYRMKYEGLGEKSQGIDSTNGDLNRSVKFFLYK